MNQVICYGDRMITCSEEGCPESIKDSAWPKIHSGWFFQKDGERFCPAHTPEWVAAWREKKQAAGQ